MLRVKRSVQALYSTQFTANLIAQQTLLTSTTSADAAGGQATEPEPESTPVPIQPPPTKRPDQVAFVRGDTLVQTHNADDQAANPDEIELDEDDDDDDEEEKGNAWFKNLASTVDLNCFENICCHLIIMRLNDFPDDMEVEKLHIPSEVFGSLKPTDEEDSEQNRQDSWIFYMKDRNFKWTIDFF